MKRLGRSRLPTTVLLLGAVSFLNDFSSEMIYPLLPLFLSGVLGAGAVALGAIEGVAEATASLLKLVSGRLSDRWRRRKSLIASGYGLAGIVRPLIGVAGSWPVVLFLRFADRLGKGIRTAPRDALIADAVPRGERAHAYGFHRAMDHAGAVVGPLVAALLLGVFGRSLRQVFLLAAIPGTLALLLIIYGIRENTPPAAESKKEDAAAKMPLAAQWRQFGRSYKIFLLAIFIFSLGKASDAFLILNLVRAGISEKTIALLWSVHHIVKVVATYAFGARADAWGHRKLIMAGWLLHALFYGLFAFVHDANTLIVLFLAYGLYFGLTEPTEKALVADASSSHARGTGFGFYHLAVGISALPASLIFGLIWNRINPEAAFICGGSIAVSGTLILIAMRSLTPKMLGQERMFNR